MDNNGYFPPFFPSLPPEINQPEALSLPPDIDFSLPQITNKKNPLPMHDFSSPQNMSFEMSLPPIIDPSEMKIKEKNVASDLQQSEIKTIKDIRLKDSERKENSISKQSNPESEGKIEEDDYEEIITDTAGYNEPPGFECEICHKTWRRQNEDLYRSHIEKAHGPFVCLVPGCRKVFAQWGGLYRHKTEVHAKKSGFQCGICKRLFKRRYVCVKHMCSIHGFDKETQKKQVLQLINRTEIIPSNAHRPRKINKPKPVIQKKFYAKRSGGPPGSGSKKKCVKLKSYTLNFRCFNMSNQ